jgi:hypothetical protein
MTDNNTDDTPAVDTDTPTAPQPADIGDGTQPAEDTDTGDTGDTGKARRQAARYRTELRAAQTERDQLRDQLGGQRRAILDWRAKTAGVSPVLLDAAGLDIDTLLNEDTGQLDIDLADQFITETATKFKIAKGFTPNRAQGQSSGQPATQPSLADAFRRR